MILYKQVIDLRVLVIGAHPDDEILGVGGTILKHIEKGDEVYCLIVTKAYKPKWSEEIIKKQKIQQSDVDELLGIEKRYNLDFKTTQLNTIPHGKFNEKITEKVTEISPDIIYTHYRDDLNIDHRLVFHASMVATRPPNNIKLVCYETLSETEWNDKPFKPNYWVDISPFIGKKIKAFKKYKTEVKDFPHPRSPEGIRNLAKRRGSEICVNYAEAFKVIRDYW